MPGAGKTIPAAAATALLLALAACADPHATAAEQNGRAAMEAGHAEAAVQAYGAALAQAEKTGDAQAIAMAGTNLAIAELAASHPGAALTDAQTLAADLARRNQKPPATLGLVTATALYRLGRYDEAAAAAKPVADGPNPAIASRARFLMGLVAAAQHDDTGILAASLVLSAQTDPASVAETTELNALLAMARGDHTAARTQALEAAKQRTALNDPRGVARCEALAADATRAGGDPRQAADLYLRAGQGEATVGNLLRARALLIQARGLAPDAATRAAANEALATLGS